MSFSSLIFFFILNFKDQNAFDISLLVLIISRNKSSIWKKKTQHASLIIIHLASLDINIQTLETECTLFAHYIIVLSFVTTQAGPKNYYSFNKSLVQ